MRKAHEQAIKAFVDGKAAHDVMQEQVGAYRIWTDGSILYSYKMPIAKRIARGKRLAFELVNYEQAPTATTRAHVHACGIILAPYPFKRVKAI